MVSYAVVGASRGIGLEYVVQLAAKPEATVFAVVRNSGTSTYLTSAAAGLKNVHVIESDVTDYASLQAAAKAVSAITGGTLDFLIHNAARMDRATFSLGFEDYASMDDLDAEFIAAYKINTLGVIHSITAFLPLLRASTAPIKRIVSISTGGADPKSVRAIGMPNMAAYCATKSAGLMVATKWAVKLKDEGFVVVSMNPGLVDTSGTVSASGDSAGRDILTTFSAASKIAMQTPAESVAAQIKVVDALQPSDNGLFLKHTGGEHGMP